MRSILTTERLRLVPLDETYVESIFSEFTQEITTYMMPKAPHDISETEEYIASQRPKLEHGEELPVVILDKVTGEFLGCGGIHHLSTRTPELGIWIKKSAHGNHYGREAVAGLRAWAEKNLDYDYLLYPVDERNIPSRKIAEALGGVVSKKYKKINQAGKQLHTIEYRIWKK